MATNILTRPRRGESPERTIKRFIKKVKKDGLIERVKKRSRYIKPSEKKRMAKKRAIAKRNKELAKQKR